MPFYYPTDDELDEREIYKEEERQIVPCRFCDELFNRDELTEGYCPTCSGPKCSECGGLLDTEIGEESISGLCSTCLGDLG